jgi:membrane fusion protein (multidrug efflux system)
MNNKKVLWIFIFVLLIAAFTIPKLLPKKDGMAVKAASGNIKGKPSKSLAVTIKPAVLSPIQEQVNVTGTVRASKEIELRNEIAGKVIGIYFKEGMIVKKGQLLLKLNDNDLQAQLAKVQASLKLAQERETRQRLLLEKEAISTEEYQTSLKELETNQADEQLLKAQIEKSRIIAPFSGAIGLSSIDEGAYLSAGSKVANLVSVDELEIECSVAERYIPYINKGTKVTYTVAGSQKTYIAEISAIEPRIDEASRTIAMKATCTDPDIRVIAGAFVKVEIKINPHDGILLPSNALLSDAGGFIVYVAKENQAVPRTVQTGFRDENAVEITSGLSPGDSVITTGVFLLRPKMSIEIKSGDKVITK